MRRIKTKKAATFYWIGIAALLIASRTLAQASESRHQHRPAAAAANGNVTPQPQPTYEFFSILNGIPMGLVLHHDTEVGTGRAVDVYMFPIELQVMNSDGNLEPVGLIFDNFYTAKAVNTDTAPNPYTAHDCKLWNSLVLSAMSSRDPKSRTWPYIQFTVAQGARTIQTNEDGYVWWSDDIQCVGSDDRFPPF